MDSIKREITELITEKYSEELQKLFAGTGDISKFIAATKEMLDKVGDKLVAQALETSNGTEETARNGNVID